MLPKKNRLDRKLIENIFKNGYFINSTNLSFRFILNKKSSISRISFVAPKGIAKLAVKRNYLRRLGYSVLEKYLNQFPLGIEGVFIFKKYQASPIGLQPRDYKFIIENEIKNIIKKI